MLQIEAMWKKVKWDQVQVQVQIQPGTSKVRVPYDAVKSKLSHYLLSLASSLEHVAPQAGKLKMLKCVIFWCGTGWGQTDSR